MSGVVDLLVLGAGIAGQPWTSTLPERSDSSG